LKDFHTITRTNAGARIHAHARIIFASFYKSLQSLNKKFTYTMKTANNERNASRQGKLSRATARAISGRFTAYFGHIPKSAVFLAFFRLFVVFFRRVLL
jgi:hypothetical protein